MPNNYFKCKQFTIIQDKSAMKVGTDGFLLGAYANCVSASHILDIGTGTGLIALMLAQRSNAIIDAIEIDMNACEEACENISNSKWSGRITVFHKSFQEYAKNCIHKYGLIVSNPPYFSNSLKNPNKNRSMARHDDALPTNELFDGVNHLLTPDGIFTVIIPADNLSDFETEANKPELHLIDLLKIKPTPNKPAKRVIASFSPQKQILKVSEMVIESGGRHVYSDRFKELVKD